MDKFSRKIKKARDREKCGRVKEIEKKRDRLDSLKSGMSSTDPVKGGGSNR